MLYDQASVEIKGASSEISQPQKWDRMDNIYYVEMTWHDCTFANSGKKYQFSVGFYGKGYTENNVYYVYDWDPTNDWSYQTLKLGEKSDFFAVEDPPEVLCENICVYDNGVLVGGIEPDGTVPVVPDKTETSTTTTTTTAPKTTTTTASGSGKYLAGDANEDGDVNMADSVAIMRSQADPDEFALTAQGKKNGDVTGGGDGISNNDALAIQKFEAGIYTELPVD
jgi:hypothetical protein